MQHARRQDTAGGTGGRSSVERLAPAVRDDADTAIADGATTDEITARIRARGGDCSRSAVGRYAKRVRDLIRRQHEVDRIAREWGRALGEHPEGDMGQLAIEVLRTQAVLAVAELDDRKATMAPEEIARLALALRRMEGADRLRIERERMRAKAAPRADGTVRRRGLSAETVAEMRRAIEGPHPGPPPEEVPP